MLLTLGKYLHQLAEANGKEDIGFNQQSELF